MDLGKCYLKMDAYTKGSIWIIRDMVKDILHGQVVKKLMMAVGKMGSNMVRGN